MNKKECLRKTIEAQLITAKHRTFGESKNSLATLQNDLRGICMELYIFNEITWDDYMMFRNMIDKGIDTIRKERGC